MTTQTFSPVGRVGIFAAESDDAFPIEGKIVAVRPESEGDIYEIECDGETYGVAAEDVTVYLASTGDWVRFPGGECATVTRANPVVERSGRQGTYYDLLFHGGGEQHLYHWSGADTLTRPTFPGGTESPIPLFTVVNSEV